MTANFLVISLCNNDFGQGLEDAAHTLMDMGLESQEDKLPIINEVVIASILGKAMKQQARSGANCMDGIDGLKQYLRSKVKVTFSRTRPSDDHDSGSIYIDLKLGKAFRY